MRAIHKENHLVERIGWLRAAVLGANDGIISTASLILGVASAASAPGEALIAGVAGLVAGAMSMAAGEYVSVSSQSDTENADLARETAERASQPDAELDELAQIYVGRGVEPDLAREVATQLMRKDALGAHSWDELGISSHTVAWPVQAALTSALTFSIGCSTAGAGGHRPGVLAHAGRWRRVAAVPGRAGHGGRQGGRRRHPETHHPRDVLGRARDDAHHRRRRRHREGRVTGPSEHLDQ